MSHFYKILKHDIENVETQILFEILIEQILLFTAPEIDYDNWESYSKYELDKSFFKREIFHRTITIQSRLIQVVKKLKSIKKYNKYSSLLSDIEFDDNDGRQKYYELNLNNF